MQIEELVSAQRAFFNTGATKDAAFRRRALAALRQAVTAREADICAALKEDLHKSPFESYMCETGLVLSELTYMEKHLMDMANSDLVINTTQKMDMISKQLYIQSRSFDDVVEMCKNHDEMLRCIPAIQPVSNKDLRKTASGYGTRIDPIYGTSKFHEGMDFSAPQGTDVYATGDGTVVQMGWQSGYGNRIVIDHGFGYQTVYAHLRDFRTKLGKKVVRGEVIGGVGSTGKSTGPHLHYEVHVKGKVVNPVNYYFMDLSAEDYDRMIQIAANHGKVLD